MKNKFRKRKFEFTPQVDVEMPTVSLEEGVCGDLSFGVVYDLILRSQHSGKSIITTLTIEELVTFRAMIDHLIELRKSDLERQNPIAGKQ